MSRQKLVLFGKMVCNTGLGAPLLKDKQVEAGGIGKKIEKLKERKKKSRP